MSGLHSIHYFSARLNVQLPIQTHQQSYSIPAHISLPRQSFLSYLNAIGYFDHLHVLLNSGAKASLDKEIMASSTIVAFILSSRCVLPPIRFAWCKALGEFDAMRKINFR